MRVKKSIFALVTLAALSINSIMVSGEEVTTLYNGIENAQEIINNIDFRDVASLGRDYWAKDAIYKMASLSIIKGYGEKSFRPKGDVTKAEALALIYRALGKEAEAYKEGQTLEENRTEDLKKKSLRNVWADGYLSLAQKDGLITNDEFDQALEENIDFMGSQTFNPNSPAQRQDVAAWIAKAFKIEPVYNPVYVFNQFNDWEKIDQDKVSYIEALLTKRIMNGDNGYFYPNSTLKRDEMAQILSNMQDYIYKQNKLSKVSGFIEDIDVQIKHSLDSDTVQKTLQVRMKDGSLSQIKLETVISQKAETNKEVGSHSSNILQNEVIVNKNGTIEKSDILSKDDEITMIFDENNKIYYIEAKLVSAADEIYYGTVNSVDENNRNITFYDSNNFLRNFPVSQGAVVSINNDAGIITDIPYRAKAYFTVSHNMISRIEVTNSKKNNETISDSNRTDARGIVQEINANLKYISLYNENGKKDEKLLRTFNFTPATRVYKDGQSVEADSIEAGDTVYIKFDEDYNLEQINAESNNISKIGEVLYIGKDFITVEFDDGTTQQLYIDGKTMVIKDGSVTDKTEIHAGDMVKLTLNQNDSSTITKIISIQGKQNYITSIYKGRFNSINENEVVLENPKTLIKDRWVLKQQRGFVKINLDEKVKMYYKNEEVAFSDSSRIYSDKDIYAAVYKDYGGNEKVVMITSNDGFEKLYNDEITTRSASGKNIGMANNFDSITYGLGTITVKNGRLINPANLKPNDPIYAVSLREPLDGKITAQVINITKKPNIEGVDIYRGRIASINEGNSFILESFSILKGTEWEFFNTPKTFDLTADTRIVNGQGLVSSRDFIDYSSGSYKDKIIYIAAKKTQAMLISNADYGVINLRGEIYNTSLSSQGSSTGKNTLSLIDAVVLNTTTGKWDSLGEAYVDAVNNTIVIKNGEVIGIDQLEVYDKIRIIKKDNSKTGDAFIVLVEG